jgi:hypothetical protein
MRCQVIGHTSRDGNGWFWPSWAPRERFTYPSDHQLHPLDDIHGENSIRISIRTGYLVIDIYKANIKSAFNNNNSYSLCSHSYFMFWVWLKLNFVNFDKILTKKYQHLQYKTCCIRILITYIFKLFVFGIVNIDVFFYILGQNYRIWL